MDLTETLLNRTYRLLEMSTLTLQEIATGARVDINWLAKFRQRRIAEPGVGKVQRVHDFLESGEATSVPCRSSAPVKVA